MFTKLLSPQSLARLETIRTVIHAAYESSNEDLGVQLLSYARKGQEQLSYPATPWGFTYTTSFFWGAVPELAVRLNPALERTQRELDCATELGTLTPYQFRVTLGYYLKNLPCTTAQVELGLLTREACNGNLVALGVDRVCPGVLEDANDPLTVSLASIARCRKSEYSGIWTPAIMASR